MNGLKISMLLWVSIIVIKMHVVFPTLSILLTTILSICRRCRRCRKLNKEQNTELIKQNVQINIVELSPLL